MEGVLYSLHDFLRFTDPTPYQQEEYQGKIRAFEIAIARAKTRQLLKGEANG